MKLKCLTISFLLLILIFSLNIDASIIPLWASVSVVIISTFTLVYYLIHITSIAKNDWYSHFAELQQQFLEQKAEVIKIISDNQTRLIEFEKEKAASLHEHIKGTTDKTLECLEVHTNGLNRTIHQHIDRTNALEQSVKELGTQIKSQVSFNLETITNKLNAIKNDITKENEDIKTHCDILNGQLEAYIVEEITRSSEKLSVQLDQVCKRLTEEIDTCVSTSSHTLMEIIDNVKKENMDSSSQLLMSTKEQTQSLNQKIDGLIKQNENMSGKMSDATNQLSKQSDSINDMVNQTKKELAQKISEGNIQLTDGIDKYITELHELMQSITNKLSGHTDAVTAEISRSKEQISDCISEGTKILTDGTSTLGDKILIAIADNLEKITCNNEEKSDYLLRSTKDEATKITKDIETLKIQNVDLQNSISEKYKKMLEVSDNANKSMCNTKDELENLMRQKESDMENCVNVSSLEVLNTLGEKLAEIQNVTANVAKNTDKCLFGISEQCDKIGKGVASIEFKTRNIEETVSLINDDNSKNEVVDSIKTLIAEIKDEQKRDVSDINGQILNSQISQEAILNELNKLQTLLRAVLNSNTEYSSGYKSEHSSTTVSHINQQSKGSKDANDRTETIVDDVTKNIVNVEYKDGKIVKSIMKDKKGHLIYELEYINHKIARSRNYDGKGNLTIEQTYYDNGQVHYRNEYTKVGKKTTEFEMNGNKK